MHTYTNTFSVADWTQNGDIIVKVQRLFVFFVLSSFIVLKKEQN